MNIAFVWPFWQRPAKYDELRWSVRSVYANFAEPGVEIETIVVGDQPVIRRHTESWYSGKVIHVPRTVRGAGAAGIEDQCGKWMRALEDESLPDTIVWMMDDVYFIKRVTLDELRLPRSMGKFSRERLAGWKPKNWWQLAKKQTMQVLLERGLPTFDFATHLPHVVDRKRALELLRDYDLPKSRLLWECIYENVNLAESPQSAAPFLRIISQAKCLRGTFAATEKASVMVSAGNSWNEAHRTYLFDTFPHSTPVEKIPPLPPKGRKAGKKETTWTKWGEGYTATSGKAQEQEFSNFLVSLIKLNRPRTIIETGIGDGLTTRKLVAASQSIDGCLYTAFEHDEHFRKNAKVCGCVVSNLPTPTQEQIENADFLIFDSTFEHRKEEIRLWWEHGRPGSTMVVHDVSDRHGEEKIHRQLYDWLTKLGIKGVYLHNPRGGFMACHPGRADAPIKKPFFNDILYMP